SCTQYAVQADGAEITTVEGLARAGQLNTLQSAFARHHALQCGFCTAGILMSATQFLQKTPRPSEAQVRDMLSGHICRCTGYAPPRGAAPRGAEPPGGPGWVRAPAFAGAPPPPGGADALADGDRRPTSADG